MDWHPLGDGATLSRTGSEGGVIVRDDEHPLGARITLERGGGTAPFAITCGIAGWLAHTRFFSTRAEADAAFNEMKAALAHLMKEIPLIDGSDAGARLRRAGELIAAFVDRHP